MKLPSIPSRFQPVIWAGVIVAALLLLAGPKSKTFVKSVLSEIAWAALVGLAILTLFTGGPAWLGLAGAGLALRGTVAAAALGTLVGTAVSGPSGPSAGQEACKDHGGVRLVAGSRTFVCRDGFQVTI